MRQGRKYVVRHRNGGAGPRGTMHGQHLAGEDQVGVAAGDTLIIGVQGVPVLADTRPAPSRRTDDRLLRDHIHWPVASHLNRE
jgi:hypothetical protein